MTLDKRVTELNISELYKTQGSGGTNRYTLETAIAQVEEKYRTIVGLKITFINNATEKTETWAYNGGTFTNTTSWSQGSGSGGNKILEWNTDVASTRKQVLQQDRKAGMQISYLHPDNGWVNEQFIGTSLQILDGTFEKDNLWQQIPNSNSVSMPFNLNDINNVVKFTDEEILSWEAKFITSSGQELENSSFRLSPMYEISNAFFYAIRIYYSTSWQSSLPIAQYDENKNIIPDISFDPSKNPPFYPYRKSFQVDGYALFAFHPKCRYYKVSIPLSSGAVKSKVEIIGLNKSLAFINNTDYPNRNLAATNLYGYIGTTGDETNSQLSSYCGTEFIEIEKGDIIYSNTSDPGSAAALVFYDEDKQLIETATPTTDSLHTGIFKSGYIWKYVVNDDRYKYVRGSFQVSRTSGIFFIKRAAFKTSINQPIDSALFDNKARFDSYIFPITNNICNSDVTITGSTDVSIEGNTIKKTGSTAYGSLTIDLDTKTPAIVYPNCINLIMLKLKLVSIDAEGVEEVVLTGQFQGTKTYVFKEGEEKIIFVVRNAVTAVRDELAYLSDTPLFIYNNSTWEITDKMVIHLNRGAFKAMQEFCYSDYDTNSNSKQQTGFDGSIIHKIPDFWNKAKDGFNFVEASVYAKYSSNFMPSEELNQKTYASFGDSITEYAQDTVKISTGDKALGKLSYPTHIAAYFNLKLLNLGKSGSTPRGNLTDENLAKLPVDTVLVTLSGGQNGWVTDDDIDSLDRSTDVGCFNYAIDYIRGKFPKCQIVLVPTYIGNGDSQCIKDYKRISDNKNVPIADTNNLKLIDWERDKSENIIRYDNVHLTGYGAKRFAAVVRETIRPLIF